MHNVKLLNNDDNMTPSTSSQAASRRQRPSSSQKRQLMNENSIDADEIDLALSLAFPSNMDNMKKYTDDIWRKTLSSDCDPPILWETQNEPSTPIDWQSTSRHGLCSPPKNHFYGEDIWSGGNIFFPTSAPLPSTSSRLSAEVRHRKKIPSGKKTTSEFDDDFDHMKKRLSLTSLRSSLCRQKAVENLNNGNAVHAQQRNTAALDADNDFLQVDL